MYPLVETALQIALDAGGVLEDKVVVIGLGVSGHPDRADAAAGGSARAGRRATTGERRIAAE